MNRPFEVRWIPRHAWLSLKTLLLVVLNLLAQQQGLTSTTVALEGDLPGKSELPKLYDEMDQRQAAQCYLWALPLVAFAPRMQPASANSTGD